jgi:hypothetical protein
MCPRVTASRPSTPPASITVAPADIPSVIHREIVQVWAQMVRRHQEVAWI